MHLINNHLSSPVYVACSGGVDSMCLLNILHNRKKDIQVLFFNHGDEDEAEELVTQTCEKYKLTLHKGHMNDYDVTSTSREANWRNARYEFFSNFTDRNICLGHNLDDVLETYFAGFATIAPKIIPYRRNNCIRPMLTIRKQEILDYAKYQDVKWIECYTNTDATLQRAKMRLEIIDQVIKLNPGVFKTLKKRIIERGFE